MLKDNQTMREKIFFVTAPHECAQNPNHTTITDLDRLITQPEVIVSFQCIIPGQLKPNFMRAPS